MWEMMKGMVVEMIEKMVKVVLSICFFMLVSSVILGGMFI